MKNTLNILTAPFDFHLNIKTDQFICMFYPIPLLHFTGWFCLANCIAVAFVLLLHEIQILHSFLVFSKSFAGQQLFLFSELLYNVCLLKLSVVPVIIVLYYRRQTHCFAEAFVLLFIEQKTLVYNEFCSLSLSLKKWWSFLLGPSRHTVTREAWQPASDVAGSPSVKQSLCTATAEITQRLKNRILYKRGGFLPAED